ncbi:MAG: ATP-binding protein [Desulfuromonadaceae bacterium]|nr:ATP-binding protein [Desulfuromonadaceae bacterium]
MSNQIRQRHRTATIRIVMIYALFGLSWIYGSDTVLGWVVHNPAVMVKIAVIKGSLFILCTATLLYFLIGRFVRQRADIEQRRVESLKNYEALFNATNEAIFVHDAQSGRILDVNERMLEMYGYRRDEVLAADVGCLSAGTPPYSQTEAAEQVRKALFEGPQVFEWLSRKKTGELFWSEVSLKKVSMHDYDRIIAVVRDISGRKQSEEEKSKLKSQLQQAQKMESVGRLAGGVAHDFNNMLGVILGHAELAIMKTGPSHPLSGHLEEIRNAAERSADLTRQLLAFARKQAVAPKVLKLNETVAGMLKMLQRLIGEDISLTWQPGTKLWPVKLDTSQIDQVLANLCVNARDAIENTGRITIETENKTIDRGYCASNPEAVPGEYVRLAISDDGCGMDKETLNHIFEPFFTTKCVGKGTGLGLATVYGIVKQNNGFINVYSEPGQGTTFTIYLPRHEGATGEVRTAAVPKPARRGHETVLLVEDEAAILNMATLMLENLGYTVLAASSPAEALRLAEEHSGRFHLLMTDVIMPEMNGRDLAKNLLANQPGMKCLYMSGYTANVIVHHGVLDEGLHFIQKPFSLPDLATKVREILNGPNQTALP